MTALTADANLVSRKGTLSSFPMADNIKIYKGSIVCINTSGYAVVGADTASYVSVGIADQQVDNTLTGHTAGGKSIRVRSAEIVTLPATGMAQSSVGLAAYVADSGSVGLTATNNILAGLIVKYNSATSVDVWMPPVASSLNGVAGLTSTSAELNVLHSVTAGTTTASKGLVVDSNSRLNVLNLTKLSIQPTLADTYSATISLVVPGTSFHTIAAANGTSATTTINASGAGTTGDILIIRTATDASGTVTATFGTNFKSTGTQATTASKFSTITFISDGTNFCEIGRATAM